MLLRKPTGQPDRAKVAEYMVTYSTDKIRSILPVCRDSVQIAHLRTIMAVFLKFLVRATVNSISVWYIILSSIFALHTQIFSG